MTVLLRLITVAAVLVAAIATAWSFPTLYGDTGLVLVPTADTLSDTHLELGVSYARINGDAGGIVMYPVRMLYGVSDTTELFLVLANSQTSTPNGGFDAFGGGFKVALLKEDLVTDLPGIAFGARIYQLSGAIDQRVTEGYVALSKTIFKQSDILDEEGFTVRLHGAGFYERFTGSPAGETFYSFGGGLSYNNFNGTSVVVDYVPALESGGITFRDAEVSAALRRPLSPEFLVELGLTQPFNQGTGSSLYAGLLYHWGIREVPKVRKPRIDTSY